MLTTVVNGVVKCRRRLACEVRVGDPTGWVHMDSGYAAQLDALRSAAKWLVAALAGVAVLLVGGLQLSGIGQLPVSSWRLYAAASAAGLALAAVGYMIREASVVLTHEWLTLASFADEPGPALRRSKKALKLSAQLQMIEDKLAASRHELFAYAAPTVEQLHKQLRETDEQIWAAKPGTEAAFNAQRRSTLLRQAAHDTVQYANYYFTLKLFQQMRVRIGLAAVVVAVSVGLFAYAANPPTPAELLHVKVVSVKPLPRPRSQAIEVSR
jgi:hypothetical protein